MTDLMNLPEYTTLIFFIGMMAFVVSVITEALKSWTWFDVRVPTSLTVIVLSLVLCPLAFTALMSWYGRPVEWYEVFASMIAAFVVALVAMDGWERVTELFGRLMRKA